MKKRSIVFILILVAAFVFSAFSACSKKETFTVTFEANGGAAVVPITYRTGDEAIALPTTAREGYTFEGWWEDPSFGGAKVGDAYTPTKDITLYAKWTANQSTEPDAEDIYVTFVTNSDEDIARMQYTGTALTLPVPFKYGYEFVDWYAAEDFSGAPVQSPFAPEKSVTLYAKYREVAYVYLYWGVDGFEQTRWTKEIGETIASSELPVPEPIEVDGVSCPFVKWTYEDGTDIGDTMTAAEGVTILLAQYDMSGIPVKAYLKDNGDGTYTSTGNVAYTFLQKDSYIGIYSVNIALAKGARGAAGIAFRMSLSGNDYAFQDEGSYYLSAGIVSETGYLNIASVTNGTYSHMAGSSVALSALPKSWQEKWENSYGCEFTMTVVDYGTSFEIYLDGELAFTYSDAATLANYTGTGFGIRSTTNGTDFSDSKYRNTTCEISFDSLGGSAVESVEWYYGPLTLPEATKAGYVLEGWYYDRELTQKVSSKRFFADEDTTLYAKWTDDYYTIRFESNGGSACGDVYWVNGTESTVEFPTPTYAGRIFLGWYYDRELTQPLDENNPVITDDITLYAGYRLPVDPQAEKGDDGTYTVSGPALIVDGILDSRYFEITADVTFVKGAGGGIGIMFYGSVNADNSWEAPAIYIAAQLLPGTGGIQVAQVNPTFSHLRGEEGASPLALTKLPAAWQAKYNAAEAGSTVSATLKVVCTGTSFCFYIDGDQAFTYTDASVLSSATGMAYGARDNSAGSTIRFTSVKQYFSVTFMDGDTTVGTEYVTVLDKALPDTTVATDADGAYLLRFAHWTDREGNTVENVTEDMTVYACRNRVDLWTVTYQPDNGEENLLQYYEDGAALTLAGAPFKNGTTVDGVTTGYTFDGWYLNSTKVTSEDTIPVTGNLTLVAQYNESIAYTVSFETNVEGMTLENMVVAEGASVSLPTAERSGYRLAGWFTDEGLTKQYTDEAVTGNLKLYASWIKLVTVTFVSGGETVATITIDEGTAIAELPAISGKPDETKANGNVVSYAVDGWYVGGTKIDAAYTFGADSMAVAEYTATETRNGYTVVSGGEGLDGYIISGTCAQQGITIPGVEIETGEFSFTLTANKPSAAYNVRLAFYVKDAGLMSLTGVDEQGTIWINFNLYSGGVIFGRKIAGNTNNTFMVAYSQIADCAFKTYFSSISAGSEMTLNFKAVFTPGAVKYYVNDCLLFVYGDIDYSGETLYGVVFNDSNVSSADGKTALDAWLADPSGLGVAIWSWQNTSAVGGSMTVSDVCVKQGAVVTFDNDNGTVSKTVQTIGGTVALPADPSKSTTVEGDTATYYTFEGWYIGDTRIDSSYLVEQDVVITARYTETAETVYSVTFVTNQESVTVEPLAVPAGEVPEVEALDDIADYRFDGWYTDSSLTAAYVPTAATSSFELYAKWVKVVTQTISDVTYTYDEADESHKTFLFNQSYKGGIVVPGATVREGVFEFDMSYDKNNAVGETIRVAFYVFNDDIVLLNPTSNTTQRALYMHINPKTGTCQWGTALGASGKAAGTVSQFGGSGPVWEKWTKAGTTVDGVEYPGRFTLHVRLEYNTSGAKLYIDDCLISVIGSADYTGETLYGKAFTTSGETAFSSFIEYLNSPAGYGIGWIVWQNFSTDYVKMSGVEWEDTTAVIPESNAAEEALLPSKEE